MRSEGAGSSLCAWAAQWVCVVSRGGKKQSTNTLLLYVQYSFTLFICFTNPLYFNTNICTFSSIYFHTCLFLYLNYTLL